MITNFLTLAGLIIGLGAVTVIDSLGFLGRRSSYWTLATVRAHKVTKPLIWIGTALYAAGLYFGNGTDLQKNILFILILNGLFLSFYISPFLLKREKAGKADQVLPDKIQRYIAVSFIISFLGWWGSVYLVAANLV